MLSENSNNESNMTRKHGLQIDNVSDELKEDLWTSFKKTLERNLKKFEETGGWDERVTTRDPDEDVTTLHHDHY